METFGRVLRAVAFDLDGTLYPNYRLYWRLFPFLLRHPRFFAAFTTVRRPLHDPGRELTEGMSFYEEQASLMAAILGRKAEEIKEKTQRLIYQGWDELFSGIQPFPFVRETLTAFRQAGLRLAILSDFPPERKIVLLGLDGFFEAAFSTEETGRLKPSIVPFQALAGSLKLEPQEILYVGNSPKYDAAGARLAGMKTALIKRSILSTGHCPDTGGADFIFRNYRQLRKYVLG